MSRSALLNARKHAETNGHHAKPKPSSAASPGTLDFATWDFSKRRAVEVTIPWKTCKVLLEDRNRGNRPISERRVEEYAFEMVEGRWRSNGETIKFDRNGALIDGQHRLLAAVEAECDLTILVAFGLEPDDFGTIDRGKAKKLSDDLSRAGEANTSVLASVVAMAIAIEDGKGFDSASTPRSEVATAYLNLHPELRDCMRIKLASHVFKLMVKRVACYAQFRFAKLDPEAADQFMEDLATGAGLDATDPVLKLRNILIDNRSASRKLTPTHALALAFKAWNFRRGGHQVKNLSWRGQGASPEPFPIPV